MLNKDIAHLLLIAIVLSIVVFTAGCSTKKETASAINEELKIGNNKGDKAPDFTVTTIDGEIIKLSGITAQNKPILFEFIATWCPFCQQDLAAVNRVYPKYSNDVEFVAISLDLEEDAQKLKNYKVQGNHDLIDFAPGSAEILKDYGIRSTTTKFAIGRDGTILWTGSGAVDDNTWEIIFKGLISS